jgi:WD40 repeat protein
LEVYAAAGRYTSLALSPDGQLLAAGTGGGAVSVLDPKTGALLVSLPGHAERGDGGGLLRRRPSDRERQR